MKILTTAYLIFLFNSVALLHGYSNNRLIISQTDADTILAEQYIQLAEKFRKDAIYDSSNYYYNKGGEIYLTTARYFEEKENQKVNFKEPEIDTSSSINISMSKYFWRKYFECQNQICWNLITFQGKANLAIDSLENILNVMNNNLSEIRDMLAILLNTLGVGYFQNGDFDRAVQYYRQSLLINLQIYGQQHALVAKNYNNIGIIYWQKGDFDKALENYNTSLKIKLKETNLNKLDIATTYNNIGVVYRSIGDYFTALEYYNQSLLIRLNLLGNLHPYVATNYNNIGVTYHDLEEHTKALENYQKSLSIRIQTVGEEHHTVAQNYNNIGTLYKNSDKALEYYKKALVIKLKKLNSEHPEVAATYLNIANYYSSVIQHDSAFMYYNKSLEIYTKVYGKSHYLVGHNFQLIGNVFSKQKQFSKALDYYQKAIQSMVNNFTDTSIYVNPVLKRILKPGEPVKIEGVTQMIGLRDILISKAETLYLYWEEKNNRITE